MKGAVWRVVEQPLSFAAVSVEPEVIMMRFCRWNIRFVTYQTHQRRLAESFGSLKLACWPGVCSAGAEKYPSHASLEDGCTRENADFFNKRLYALGNMVVIDIWKNYYTRVS